MIARLGLAFLLVVTTSGLASARARKERAPKEKPAPAGQPPEAKGEGKPQFHPEEGPKKIDLGHDVILDLPAGMLFLEKGEATQMMEKMGNVVGDSFLGLVGQSSKSWLVTINYFEDGYVKDDDAADFKPDDILESLREGNEEANQVRQQRGFKPLQIDGWTESPRYERAPHHLVWGLKVHDADGESINFYTRMLGRRGFVALNLIDSPERIESSKTEALAVLKATTFVEGARYQDFDSKKDKVAEYGLAALVAGGAGAAALKFAKVGLLAKFGGKLIALIIAGKKLIVVGLLAIGALLKRVLGFRRKKEEAAPPPPPAAPL